MTQVLSQVVNVTTTSSSETVEQPQEQPQKRVVLADRYKTKLCAKWLEKGKCPYDRKCMFAHGEHELRTYEMNMRDGLTTEDSIRLFRIHQRAGYTNRPRPDVVLMMTMPAECYQGSAPQQQQQHQQCQPAEFFQHQNSDCYPTQQENCYHQEGEYYYHQHQHFASSDRSNAAAPTNHNSSGIYYYPESHCSSSNPNNQSLSQQGSSFGGSAATSECDFHSETGGSYATSSSCAGQMYRYDPYNVATVAKDLMCGLVAP